MSTTTHPPVVLEPESQDFVEATAKRDVYGAQRHSAPAHARR